MRLTVNVLEVAVVKDWTAVINPLIVLVKAVSLATMAEGSMALCSRTGAAKDTTARVRVIATMARKLKDIILMDGF